jgi:hypothetical protein
VSVSWEEAFSRVGEVLSTTPGNQIKATVGQLVEAESMVALKDLFNRLGSSNLYFEGEAGSPSYGVDFRYLQTSNSAKIKNKTKQNFFFFFFFFFFWKLSSLKLKLPFQHWHCEVGRS